MVVIKSKYEISLMRIAGNIVAEVLEELRAMVKPGITTFELDERAEKIIKKNRAIPTFKGYCGFPASICASINEKVVHGIPSKDEVLKEGDIISIDVGATYRGLVGDSATTVPVGKIPEETQRLLDVTKESLFKGIRACSTANYLEDVSIAIESCALEHNLGLVRDYGGHGVGRKLHEDPFIHNFKTGKKGIRLKSGMTLCLEPMFNLGCDEVYTLEDQWTVVTKDGKPSAHFENAILITKNGPELLTPYEY